MNDDRNTQEDNHNNQNNEQQNYENQDYVQQNNYVQQDYYQQDHYQQDYYQGHVEESGNGMSIAALVLGILGIVGSFIPYLGFFTFILAILGIVFGAKGLQRAKETGEGKGLATAGLVLGIVGTAFGITGVICLACVCALGSASLMF